METVALTSAIDTSRNAEVLEAHRQISNYKKGAFYPSQLVLSFAS